MVMKNPLRMRNNPFRRRSSKSSTHNSKEEDNDGDDYFHPSHFPRPRRTSKPRSSSYGATTTTRSVDSTDSDPSNLLLERVTEIWEDTRRRQEEGEFSTRTADDLEGKTDMDRATIRLDGIEVYAIVSALTCATSISCFDNFQPMPLATVWQEWALLTFLTEMAYFGVSAMAILTGLHATLVFSLVTMYGRTAVGVDRDDAFNEFFKNTGPQRYNGFRSFQMSLYCFMAQLTFLVASKFVITPLRPVVGIVTAYFAHRYIYRDSEDVIKAATVIYKPPVQMRRRSTTKFSLSTRAFGIDQSQH